MKRSAGFLFLVAMVLLLTGFHSRAAADDAAADSATATKLRIVFIVVTTEAKTSERSVTWVVPQEKLQTYMTQRVRSLLSDQGIYELVSEGELETRMEGRKVSGWQWKSDDFDLVKQAGRLCKADYALYVERAWRTHLEFDMRLMNLATGREFVVANYIPNDTLRRLPGDQKKLAGIEAIKITYRQLFSEAKGDLLQTAIAKGKIAEKPAVPSPDEAKKPSDLQPPAEPPPVKQETPLTPTESRAEKTLSDDELSQKETQPDPIPPTSHPSKRPEVKQTDRQAAFEQALDQTLSGKDQPSSLPRLVVFDFDATDNLKVIGLILTESLREALLDMGGFVLVNRENILKILDEYKLRSSGLVDETQAVKLGKWLTADDAIVGNLAVLGNTSILQAKRVNIETLGTVSMWSLRCEAGREDELLDRMSDLARKLSR